MDNNNLYDKDNQTQNGEQGQFQQQPYQQQPYQQQPYQQQPYQQQSYQQQPYQPQYQPQQPYQTGDSELEEPVTFADWMLSMLIMFIPCVNIIMMFVWAFGSGTKKSKANYFKASLVWFAIGIVFSFIMAGAFVGMVASIAESGNYYY